jgi:hypothetical protein
VAVWDGVLVKLLVAVWEGVMVKIRVAVWEGVMAMFVQVGAKVCVWAIAVWMTLADGVQAHRSRMTMMRRKHFFIA